MLKFLYGFLFLIAGILILKYSIPILKFFGHDPDADRIFSGGLGGTLFFIKLTGLAFVIGSMFYMFGFLII